MSTNGNKFITRVILLAERNTPSPGRDHPSCRRLTGRVLLLTPPAGSQVQTPQWERPAQESNAANRQSVQRTVCQERVQSRLGRRRTEADTFHQQLHINKKCFSQGIRDPIFRPAARVNQRLLDSNTFTHC